MTRFGRSLVALALSFSALALGCRGSESAPGGAAGVVGSRPNIVLVVMCSFRADRLGSLGNSRGLTPFLDRMAAAGTVFEHAVSASSWTKPSTTSLITGLTPGVHKMLDFYRPEVIEKALAGGEPLERRVLPAGFDTLPAALARADYDTFCRVNNIHAGDFFGLTRGCQDQVTRFGMSTDRMIDDLSGWLAQRDSDDPFFAYLFTREVHSPFTPSYAAFHALRPGVDDPPAEEFDDFRRRQEAEVWRLAKAHEPFPEPLKRTWIDLYDAQFPALDRTLSRLAGLLAAQGDLENTLVVVTGDHGERLFEDGRIDHGGPWLDQAVVHIPMIAWGAGVPASRRIAPVVRSIDLFPTLLDVAGAAPPALVQGKSLVPLIWKGDGPPPPSREAFSRAGPRAYALRMGRYKLRIRRGQERALYDLRTDPRERRDLVASKPRIARRLQRELERWIRQEATLSKAIGATESTRELPPDVIQQLRALGYI